MNAVEYAAYVDDPSQDHQTYEVYRYWNDLAPVGHQLLYVGFTSAFYRRDPQHWRSSPWRRQATRWEVEIYPTEGDAKDAEFFAIRSEVPIHNSVHTDVEKWVEHHGEYMEYVNGPRDRADQVIVAAVMEAMYGTAS